MLQGVIVYFRITDGELNVGDRVMLMNTRKEHVIDELGVLAPKPVNVRLLLQGAIQQFEISAWHTLASAHLYSRVISV